METVTEWEPPLEGLVNHSAVRGFKEWEECLAGSFGTMSYCLILRQHHAMALPMVLEKRQLVAVLFVDSL